MHIETQRHKNGEIKTLLAKEIGFVTSIMWKRFPKRKEKHLNIFQVFVQYPENSRHFDAYGGKTPKGPLCSVSPCSPSLNLFNISLKAMHFSSPVLEHTSPKFPKRAREKTNSTAIPLLQVYFSHSKPPSTHSLLHKPQ